MSRHEVHGLTEEEVLDLPRAFGLNEHTEEDCLLSHMLLLAVQEQERHEEVLGLAVFGPKVVMKLADGWVIRTISAGDRRRVLSTWEPTMVTLGPSWRTRGAG